MDFFVESLLQAESDIAFFCELISVQSTAAYYISIYDEKKVCNFNVVSAGGTERQFFMEEIWW